MRSTATLIATNNPHCLELIAGMGIAVRNTLGVMPFAPAAEITRHTVQAQASVHGLLDLLQGYGRYEADLADTAYDVASGAIERLEAALETEHGCFCESGVFVAGGLAAYEAILSAAVMGRGIRSQRLGLKDPMWRVQIPEYDYAE